MFATKISLNIVRRIRVLKNRKILPTIKQNEIEDNQITNPVFPLSESDLQSLKEKYAEEYIPELKPRHSNITEEDFELTKPLAKSKGKKTLMDFRLEIPLQEPVLPENQYEMLSKVVTPLSKTPYHKQLFLKEDYAKKVLFALKKEMRKYKVPLAPSHDNLPCPLEKIYPSPDIVKYRNKDEFSISVGVDGDSKTVGYFVSNPKDPLMRCVSPTNLINVRDSHKLIAKHFQNFIQSSPYRTCLGFKNGGLWRNILVRSTLDDERMASVKIFPGDFPDDKKAEIKDELRKYFFQGQGMECKLTSLYMQACPHARCSRELAPYELIEGQAYITESCLGRKFLISPDSFFHTNTKAAEILYETVKKISEVSTLTTVLDIMCGAGTISTLLASNVRGCIGIDTVKGAIDDAKMNAKYNNITNTNFIPGKVEDILPVLINDLNDCTEVLTVVSPARNGLTPAVIETIRNCKSIKKLVYICQKPEGNIATNMALLGSTLPWKKCLTKRRLVDPGDPFVPTYAVHIDMFPHTLYTEYVILFERVEIS